MTEFEGHTEEAPGDGLDTAVLLNLDVIKSGYELLRKVIRLPRMEAADEACELLTRLEEGHRSAIALLYEQTTALDRLRTGLREMYGLNYSELSGESRDAWKVTGYYCPTDATPFKDSEDKVTSFFVDTEDEAKVVLLWYPGGIAFPVRQQPEVDANGTSYACSCSGKDTGRHRETCDYIQLWTILDLIEPVMREKAEFPENFE